MRLLLWLCALPLAGCGLTLDLSEPDPVSMDAAQGGLDGGRRDGGAIDAARDAAIVAPRDAHADTGFDAAIDAPNCDACDDFDPCTTDICTAEGTCAHEPASGARCEGDGNLCTREVCSGGACASAGRACPDPQLCDPASGDCSCPFDLRVCGSLCISPGTCCTNADCTAPLICPGSGGGVCSCPSGTYPCEGRCIPATECCTSATCGSGRECVGGSCVCRADTIACGDLCVPAEEHCVPGSTLAGTCGDTCFGRVCGTDCRLAPCARLPGAECGPDGPFCDLAARQCRMCIGCLVATTVDAPCEGDADCL